MHFTVPLFRPDCGEQVSVAGVGMLFVNLQGDSTQKAPARNVSWGAFSGEEGRSGLLHCGMFNFGKPKTAGDWIIHIAGAIVAIFLVWWMLRLCVL
jgi:hypothetical protein